MKKALLCCLLAAVLLPLYAEKPKRYVEFGLDVDAGAANNFLGFFDFFNEERTVVIEPSELSDSGLLINGAAGGEAFFNINFGEKFGLGFFAGFDVTMYSGFSGEFFRFLSEGNANMRDFTAITSAGASVFADAGLKTRFKFGKLSLDVSPAAYVPILYIPPPRMSYRFNTTEGIKADAHIQADGYTPLSLDNFFDFSTSDDSDDSGNGDSPAKGFSFSQDDVWHILEAWGLDLSLGAEYALHPQWDLGGSVASIPLYPATLRHRISYQFDYTMDPLGDQDLIEMIKDGSNFEVESPEMTDPVFSDDLAFRVFRPLRFDFYVQYKPLSSSLIVLKPDIGFSALTVYGYEASEMCFNAGLEAQLNLKRIFSLSLSSSYRERLWNQGAALMLNLRVFQLDLDVSLQSQDFVSSFELNGVRAAVGLRFGF